LKPSLSGDKQLAVDFSAGGAALSRSFAFAAAPLQRQPSRNTTATRLMVPAWLVSSGVPTLHSGSSGAGAHIIPAIEIVPFGFGQIPSFAPDHRQRQPSSDVDG